MEDQISSIQFQNSKLENQIASIRVQNDDLRAQITETQHLSHHICTDCHVRISLRILAIRRLGRNDGGLGFGWLVWDSSQLVWGRIFGDHARQYPWTSELPVKLICRSGILRVECIRYKYLVGNPVYIARPGVH